MKRPASISLSRTTPRTGRALHAGGAAQRLLGDGHLFQSEKLLGVGGLVGSNEFVFQTGDFIEIFKGEDAKVGGGEAVFARILGRPGFAIRRARASGETGVGSVGSELFF